MGILGQLLFVLASGFALTLLCSAAVEARRARPRVSARLCLSRAWLLFVYVALRCTPCRQWNAAVKRVAMTSVKHRGGASAV